MPDKKRPKSRGVLASAKGAIDRFSNTAADFVDDAMDNVLPNWGDEIRGAGRALRAAANGKPMGPAFREGQRSFKADQARYDREHPTLATASTVTGTVAGMALPAGKVAKGATMAQRARQGAKWGAAYGALAGAGDGNTVAERGRNAALYGAGGAAVGAAAPKVIDKGAKVVGAALRSDAGKAATKLAKDFIADERGVLDTAAVGKTAKKAAGVLKLTHRSRNPELSDVDPQMLGLNRKPGGIAVTNREEVAAGRTATGGRSYFGVRTGEPGGYVGETNLGPYNYEAEVPADRYLHTDGDSLDGPANYDSYLERADAIRQDPEALKALGLPSAPRRSVVTERLIKNDGYDGIHYGPKWNEKYGSTQGEVVHHWGDPVPVSRVEQPMAGAPTRIKVNGEARTFGPHDELRGIASSYTGKAGIEYKPPSEYLQPDEAHHRAVAEAFDAMEHNPNDPAVAGAYNALKDETLAQYRALQDAGYSFSFMDPANDPYPNPWMAIDDLRTNKRMQVYPTDAGFGSGDDLYPGNPLLDVVEGETWDGRPVTYNDVFRAVHDAFGHAKEGVGFRAAGENAAFLQHMPTFSPQAQRAMATETLGQNSWLNFGPHGETNRTASVGDTIFAPQKIGLLPDELIYGGQAAQYRPAPKAPAAPVLKGLDGRPGAAYQNPLLISTRRPSKANYGAQGDPDAEVLVQTGQALKDAPEAYAKNMALMSEEPFMQGITGAPDEVYEQAVRRGADNLKYIAEELMDPALVDSSRHWYRSANRLGREMADQYGVTPEVAYGVNAVMSPQKAWPINVANQDRLLRMNREGFQVHEGDPGQRAASYVSNALEAALKAKKVPGAVTIKGPDFARRVIETPMDELNDAFDQYAKVVLTDALNNDPMVKNVLPDGSYGDDWGKITWGSSKEVGKALSILRDGSMANISRQMDGGGKVPSFYDNQAVPDAPLPIVTADTHSAGAVSLFPAGGSDPITIRTMGLSGPKGVQAAADSARTGSKGIYGLVTDAHALAGQELGMLPREVQSVTWEGVRNLWGQTGKTPALKKAVADAWFSSATPEEARKKIGILTGRQ